MIKSLKTKRATFKSQLTRFRRFIENYNAKRDLIELKTRINRLEQLFSNFETSQSQLEEIDESHDHLSDREIIEDTFYEITSKAKRLVLEGDRTEISLNSGSLDIHSQSTQQRLEDRLDHDISLPKINLPSFGGRYEDWPGFADQFKSTVNDNTKISDCRKLIYLRSCLTGEAARNLESLEPKTTTPPAVSNIASLTTTTAFQVLLSTAVVNILDHQGRCHACRVLLDSGSQSHFITKSMASKLGLHHAKINIPIIGINQATSSINYSVKTTIRSRYNKFASNITLLVLDRITQQLPSRPIVKNLIKIPKNVKLADPQYHKPAEIDVLLGAEIFFKLLCIGQISLSESVTMQKTQLGWILAGRVRGISPQEKLSCNVSTDVLHTQISKFWEIEENPIQKSLSPEEHACETHYRTHTQRDSGSGKFIVRLPFKENHQNLGESYTTALKRFYALEKSLDRKPERKQQYTDFVREYISLGHMSEQGTANCQDGYYLPHHAWIRTSPNTLKTFVANRVAEIQRNSSPEQWRHVISHDNPADILSRGSTPEELLAAPNWLCGPSWINYPEEKWPQRYIPNGDIPELRPIVTLAQG
ncbi:hypothetical protein KM043_017926 [Ampulex compressa]|nr:hypothetical protein KM043_017926 [Ampulex compressa]